MLKKKEYLYPIIKTIKNKIINYINTVLIVIGFWLAAVGLLYAAGARINTSNSIPEGLYWSSDVSIKKGYYVIFCPPKQKIFDEAMRRGYIDAGFCPGGYGYMMKKVLAINGDTISINHYGVQVNGYMLPYSKPISADALDRHLPYLNIAERLDNSELLLMTDQSPLSFDSRYFGPIAKSQIKAVIQPVFTW
jgi:conjugative transfer signal peptidase TraF